MCVSLSDSWPSYVFYYWMTLTCDFTLTSWEKQHVFKAQCVTSLTLFWRTELCPHIQHSLPPGCTVTRRNGRKSRYIKLPYRKKRDAVFSSRLYTTGLRLPWEQNTGLDRHAGSVVGGSCVMRGGLLCQGELITHGAACQLLSDTVTHIVYVESNL